MSEHIMPQNQDSTGDDELSTQELEDVAGGTDTINNNCPCPTNNGCVPGSDTKIDN